MNKNDLLSKNKRKVVTFNAPVLGKVHLRGWTVAELEQWHKYVEANQNNKELGFELFTRTAQKSLCDEKGELLFEDGEHDELLQFDMSALKAISEEVVRVNGLTDKDRDNFRNQDKR
jgi:hypothetical protein